MNNGNLHAKLEGRAEVVLLFAEQASPRAHPRRAWGTASKTSMCGHLHREDGACPPK